MRRIKGMLAVGLMVALIGTAHAASVIDIRLSYKVVMNPADGNRPPGVTDADIDRAIENANEKLATYWRGYRLVRVGPVMEIGGEGGYDRPDPSYYYNVDFDANQDEFNNLDSDAHDHQTLYEWNSSAVNFFIVNGLAGGHCSNPGLARESVFIGADSDSSGWTHLHELSHFLGLCHTQGCSCRSCGQGQGECNTVPGDDEIDDTLPDLPCWSRDEVSANYFNGRVYGDLNDDEKKQVDDTFSNVMSYHRFDTPQHQAHSLQTEDQLDKFADTASWVRTAARSGIVVFVDDGAGAVQNGTSELPYDTVAEGLNQAGFSSGNIVLIRPGNYPENLRISDPVTLRVPRTGTARIGSTGMVSR